MVLIFDLDDTLYDEMSFVKSGLLAVAQHGEVSYGWNAKDSFNFMETQLRLHGRGKIFDDWLSLHGVYSAKRLFESIKIYRHHVPEITLFYDTLEILNYYYEKFPLYLVTDGHKIAQKNKIDALKISSYFKRSFITHRFGIKNSKPSLHCFNIIRNSECCSWSEMVYVGDNPNKDFVNLKKAGALTIRVSTGAFANQKFNSEYDADKTIENLSGLLELIEY